MARTIPEHRFHDLVEAATQVFLEMGYRRAQIADVAARMGVAKGTVYLYVESKEALFHAVVRHADRREHIALPEVLPVPTPKAGATLEVVRARVAESSLPLLAEALERKRVSDVRAELEGIVRELFALLAEHRVGIKLLDRCAPDHPELAAAWYDAGRQGTQALLRLYIEDRVRRRRLPPVEDPAIASRIVLETLVTWAVHIHWDPAPQQMDEAMAEQAVVSFVTRALLGEA
jgi:AcrR family transcriptional regulator